MGVSLFAVGYLGFFSYLNRRHERKIVADSNKNEVATCAWRYFIQCSNVTSDNSYRGIPYDSAQQPSHAC
jgi:hypothetical protein